VFKKLNLFLISLMALIIIFTFSGCMNLLAPSPSALSIVKNLTLTGSESPVTTGQIYSSPAVSANGEIFLGDQTGLYVISGSSSRYYKSSAAVYSSPSIDSTNDMVFAGNNDGQLLYASSPFTSYNTVRVSYYPIISAPLVFKGNVYVIDNNGDIYELPESDMTDVSLIRSIGGNGSAVWASPVTNGTDLFVGADNDVFYAVNLNSGSIGWEYTMDGPIYGTAAIGVNGNIYVGADALYSLTPDGTLRWTNPLDGSQIYGSPVISESGIVYIGTINGNFYAINSQTGQTVWSVNLETPIGGISSSALIGDNEIVYIASGYTLYALNSSNGNIMSYVGLGYNVESNPVLYDGKIYVGCDDGQFYEISSGNSMASGGWPMFMHDQYHTGRQS
jgi:outer membrane protein assembly factor BamB